MIAQFVNGRVQKIEKKKDFALSRASLENWLQIAARPKRIRAKRLGAF